MNLAHSIDLAIEHHRAGRIRQAEQLYREVLAVDAGNFDALHLLGVAAHQSGDHERAVELIDRAIAVNPAAAPAYHNLGEALRALGRLTEARGSFERAVMFDSAYVEAYNSLGITLAALGLQQEALAAYERAIAANPNYAQAHYNRGGALQAAGRPTDAIAQYQRALEIDPDFARAHLMLGRAYEATGRVADALIEYQFGLQIDPHLAEGHRFLGHLLQSQGLVDDAITEFSKALECDPDYAEARWALAMSRLALVHEAQDDAATSREAFSEALAELDQWFTPARVAACPDVVGLQQPFFLAYHETNNRDLLSRYGDLCVRLMGAWVEREGIAPTIGGDDGVIRVGIVSGQIRDHSVWNAILKGWIKHLDRQRFSFHLFDTTGAPDTETEWAKSIAASYIQAPRLAREWVDGILGQQLDVLIYPEIGMDPVTMKLASMRLAPIQAVAWGHPETSGLPTIDYYFSAEDFEPENAQDNYREQLVALPHLGCCYEPLAVNDIEIDLDELGIDSRYPILICAGAPFKYRPQDDWMLVEIARRLPRCQLVFFHHTRENLSDTLEKRLEAAFEDGGLFFESRGLFLPWLKRDAFYALMRRSDVFLDTIGFSGFNTAMQAIECGLPVVARDGRFMRGRLGSGILKRLGLPELVAESDAEYIDLAVKLASDKAYGESVRRRIEADRHVLFGDMAPIRGLEEFLVRASHPK